MVWAGAKRFVHQNKWLKFLVVICVSNLTK
jgi:hypothetical protein